MHDHQERMQQDPGVGAASAADPLAPLFARAYSELYLLAQSQRRQFDGHHTLNTTALVHEVYLKLAHQAGPLRDSRCLFAVASRAMRHVLVNYAERQRAQKRGGAASHVALNEVHGVAGMTSTADEILSVDAALERLSAIHSRQARVVECRFFGGLTVEETAAALEVSTATVKRDWRFASAWLLNELTPGDPQHVTID